MKILIFNAGDIPMPDAREDHEALMAWIRSLGLDPEEIRPFGAIVNDGSGWRLHLLRHAVNGQGKRYIDPERDTVATEPIAVDLGAAPRWPQWLGQVVLLPDMPGEHVVAVLDQVFGKTGRLLDRYRQPMV